MEQKPKPKPKQNQKPHKLSSPSPFLLKDISNTFKTPLTHYKSQHFTASKQTKTARRLRAFEIEQSKSARKAQTLKIKSLKSFSKSLTIWLNFLLDNPESCGCDVGKICLEEGENGNGKRERSRDGKDGFFWREKRQKGVSGRSGKRDDERELLALEMSLREVCSLDDLKERMRYMGLGDVNEILAVMAHVMKTIDEGKLQMKPHCPIVTDVGLKEKASKILVCYNPTWLRIGLYIIFGGDSLIPDGEVNSEEEIAFLKMVIDKQFFSHAGLAKKFAYNKLVEGLYRAGYYETLGNIILKRFLLLVFILDQAKNQSYLPIKYGIDGLDGGSPLLFKLQSNIKSSSQVIHDFLSSDIMYGEGSVLVHLEIVGYKVSHQQSPINEYDFKVTELFEDLCDGVRLCRVIQLLLHDTSILMKMVVPSDTRKKNVINCGIALKALKQASVPLCDEDGMTIEEEDIHSGDKELTLSLLWNVFIHLQLPLLINRTLLLEEISRIRGVHEENMKGLALMDMLLKWMQAICEPYGCKIDGYSSLVDGKAMWCLLDYYFRKELKCSCSHKDVKETSIMSISDYTDAVHNFLLSQKLTTLLGNFPEVLEVSDVLEHNGACNSKSVIILLVFLSFQLIVKKNTDQLNFHKILGLSCQSPARNGSNIKKGFLHSEGVLNQGTRYGSDIKAATRDFKAIMEWWQDMASQNKRIYQLPIDPIPISKCLSSGRDSNVSERGNDQEIRSLENTFFSMHFDIGTAAIIIQSYFRKFVDRKNYLREQNAAVILQTAIRSWLVKKKVEAKQSVTQKQLEIMSRCIIFIDERRKFVKLRRSVTLIQRAVRAWICRKNRDNNIPIRNTLAFVHTEPTSFECETKEAYAIQLRAIYIIQLAWRKFVTHMVLRQQHLAATKIQCCYRVWFARKRFLIQKQATIRVQSHTRGWITRKGMQRLKFFIVRIQSHWRGYLTRKDFLVQEAAALKIQSMFRSKHCCKVFHSYMKAATELQRFIKGQLVRKRDLETKSATVIQSQVREWIARRQYTREKFCVIAIQRWWKSFLMQRTRTRSAIIVQCYARRWLARQEITKMKHDLMLDRRLRSATLIQYYTRSWLVRREITKGRNSLLQNTRMRYAIIIQSYTRRWLARRELMKERDAFVQNTRMKSAIVIQSYTQRWICTSEITKKRHVNMQNTRMRSAIIIQSYARGWLARSEADKNRQRVIVIQSYWKGYLARKNSRGRVVDLRVRIQKSSVNVDDGMRIINRLVAALSDLLDMKSVTGILHTCKTLDMATQHSQKCCEKLVEAGGIGTLLKLIRSVSRSVPDQEVLKHALSTLRNLARYPHLVEELISSHGSVTTIFLEFLRNKEDGFFLASDVLKKLCLNPKGIEALRSSPAFVKRLNNIVDDLKRHATNEKRNIRGLQSKEQVQRRSCEATELLKLINSGI